MEQLHIVWTSGEKDVALKVVFPYIINSKANGWWDTINLIIWGPSARLAAQDDEIQREIGMVIDSGISIEACQACTDSYKVTPVLARLGITIKYMGSPLTEYLKGPGKVITF